MAAEPQRTHSVLVLDMARSGDADDGRLVHGFATAAEARRYAEARTRASVEELRGENTTAAELRTLWYLYGEDCLVIDGDYRGSAELQLYIDMPAEAAELDWRMLTPRLKRFHAVLDVTDAAGNSAWTGGFFYRYLRPTPATLSALFRDETREAFARRGHVFAEPATLHVVKLHELFDPPEPPPGLPLGSWRVDLQFVCHDIKYGSHPSGVFAWPERPNGDALDGMARVLVGDSISLRGDSPDNADYAEVLQVRVEPTQAAPDYPPWPAETPLPPPRPEV